MASFLDFEEKTNSQDEAKAPLKRVIREILRTQVCPKTIRLLIDRIHIRKVFNGCARGDETYRMWLTDGELMIQGKAITRLQDLGGRFLLHYSMPSSG